MALRAEVVDDGMPVIGLYCEPTESASTSRQPRWVERSEARRVGGLSVVAAETGIEQPHDGLARSVGQLAADPKN